MAKRKRLTPPRPEDVQVGQGPAPETKSVFPSYPLGVAPTGRANQSPAGRGDQIPTGRTNPPAPSTPPAPTRSDHAPIARVAGDAATAAALAEVTGELEAARAQGRMVQMLDLDAIDAGHLVRDRLVVDDAEMAALRTSLAARGQQTPIEVVRTETGYGLISGWRRLSALRSLFAETKAARFAQVQALVRQPVDAAQAYVAMVEENEIRVGLSYFERARIVLRAVEEGVYPDQKKALNGLFGSGSRAKRSKIKSFLPVVSDLGDALAHPAAIGERMGLALSQRLQNDAGFARTVTARLKAQGAQVDAAEEQSLLKDALSGQAPRPPKAPSDAAREELAPGLYLERKGQGIFLSGPGLDAEVEDRVRRALQG